MGALGAIVATIGTLNGFTLLCGQVPYGATTDHIFPSALGKLSRFGTPANALMLSNLLASLLIVFNLHRGLVETFTSRSSHRRPPSSPTPSAPWPS